MQEKEFEHIFKYHYIDIYNFIYHYIMNGDYSEDLPGSRGTSGR